MLGDIRLSQGDSGAMHRRFTRKRSAKALLHLHQCYYSDDKVVALSRVRTSVAESVALIASSA